MKSLILKNYFFTSTSDPSVKPLHVFLQGLMLHGKASRSRSRFNKLLEPRNIEIEKTRVELLRVSAEKNEDGKEIYLVGDFDAKTGKMNEIETVDPTPAKNKRYKITDKVKMDEFNKKWEEYVNEEFIIDVTPATIEAIYGIRELLLNTEQEFSGNGAVLYDEWCLAFENIGEIVEEVKVENKEAVEA